MLSHSHLAQVPVPAHQIKCCCYNPDLGEGTNEPPEDRLCPAKVCAPTELGILTFSLSNIFSISLVPRLESWLSQTRVLCHADCGLGPVFKSHAQTTASFQGFQLTSSFPLAFYSGSFFYGHGKIPATKTAAKGGLSTRLIFPPCTILYLLLLFSCMNN